MRRELAIYGLIAVAVVSSFFLGKSTTEKQSKVEIKRVFVTVPSTTTTTLVNECVVLLPGGYVLHTDKQSAEKSRLVCQ